MEPKPIEIERPRTIFQLLETAIAVYQRYPGLFLALAAVVVVPYDLIVLAFTGAGPQTRGGISTGTSLLLLALDTFLVAPLISALHVHGVLDLREGNKPEIGTVMRRALPVLPVVVAAVIASWFGITLGFIALIVPGILLMLRWSVVAQTAAIEEGGWIDALKRSGRLTNKNYLHILGLVILSGLIVGFPSSLANLPFGNDTTVASFIVGTAVNTLTASFTALTTALLFFDLRARLEGATAVRPSPPPAAPAGLSGRTVEPTGHPQDPDSYSDEDRPPGWYVIPDQPWKMRFWAADGKPGWGKGTTKTPKDVLEGFYKKR